MKPSVMTSNALFLGDLSRFCTEIELSELFSHHGQVLEVKISRTSMGISLGYGFIYMGNQSQAEEAMEKLNGIAVSGRPLRVSWAARNVKDTNSYAATNEMINSIHVRFHTLQRIETLFTEESLSKFFEPYGKVVDVSIKNSSFEPHSGVQKGYGFVHFEKSAEGVQAAILAVTTETGDALVSLECEASKNLLKYHPLLVLPSKEKEMLKPVPASTNLGYQRNMSRSLSFHDVPANRNRVRSDSRDIELPNRPPPRATFPPPDRDHSNPPYSRGDYKDAYAKRKGGQFPMAHGSPQLGPMMSVHHQYMQNSSNYDKDGYQYDTDSRGCRYFLPQNQDEMQWNQPRQQAYYPPHHQNTYYDSRYQNHYLASAPSNDLSELEHVRRSPQGPVATPVSPRGSQEYQYPPSYDMLPPPQPQHKASPTLQIPNAGEYTEQTPRSDYGEFSPRSDFGEYTSGVTYVQPPSYPYTYSDPNHNSPVHYMYHQQTSSSG